MSIWQLLAFVLPLGLDSFAVSAALGASGQMRLRDKVRISAVFVVFEAGMPLIGLAAGAPLAHAIGGIADYLAAAALAAVGGWMLWPRGTGGGRNGAGLVRARAIALVGLGVSISLDELAIGFSLGLADLPVVAVIVAIAVQTFVAVQIGLFLGSRAGVWLRQWAERLAGLALIALAVYVVLRQILHS